MPIPPTKEFELIRQHVIHLLRREPEGFESQLLMLLAEWMNYTFDTPDIIAEPRAFDYKLVPRKNENLD